jgi:hypothetical protein
MKIFIFASILALLCPKPTHARLGESIDQCNLRYGDPIKKDSSRGFWLYTYDKFDLEIVVSFLDNKCFFITYTKKKLTITFRLDHYPSAMQKYPPYSRLIHQMRLGD